MALLFIPLLLAVILVFEWARVYRLDESAAILQAYPIFKYHISSPRVVKALYLTSSSAGSDKKINEFFNFAGKNGINAAVVDVKDYSGYISYDTSVAEAEKYQTERPVIKDVDRLIRRLHGKGIYIIARITVFQDPALAKARPSLAIKNGSQLWYDNKGLAWIDPASRDAWQYDVAIARDASERGFDEINFDYIRFPSDGDMSVMKYPFWDGKISKSEVLMSFFKYIRDNLPDTKISADMFGFVTTRKDDLGIGQIIENAFAYFDYVSPMLYPSHYPPTFLGYSNPAEHPYEVVRNAMDGGLKKLADYKASKTKRGLTPNDVKIRPWLQDFDLGADYNVDMVRAEIKAVADSYGENFSGFMLWNASNVYTEGVSR